MMAWVQTNNGAFDLGYYIMAAFMLAAAVLLLTVKYRWNGEVREDMAQLKAEEEAVLATN